MSSIPELPVEIETKINDLLKNAGEFTRGGDVQKGIDYALKAWDLIPEPKEVWMMYPQIMAINMAEKYVLMNDQNNFRKWINIAYKMYHSPEKTELSILKIEGKGYYKMKNYDEAYKAFHKIFELYGRKGFPGKDIDCYKFMMEYENKNNERN